MSMKMNVEQYQKVYAIPSGLTASQYTKEVVKIFNIDGNKFTTKEIKEKIDSIRIPEPKGLKSFKITIDGKDFSIVKDIMKSSFNEWIQYESVVGASPTEYDIVRNLHKILAIFVRPTKRKWLFWKSITPLAETDIDENEKYIKKMDIEDALNINVFFYLREMNFITDTKRYYLNHRTKLAQVKTDTEHK